MRLQFNITVLTLLCLYATSTPAQIENTAIKSQLEKKRLTVFGRVQWRSYNNNCKSENCFNIIDYEVLNVCNGEPQSYVLKVAQAVENSKNLEIGDEACLMIEETNVFTQQAEDVRSFGVEYPEELAAKYIWIGYEQSCTCK